MKKLTQARLVKMAKIFCETEMRKDFSELYGITDGKAIGTFIEHKFQQYLKLSFDMEVGSSARGIDLPSVNT